MHLILLSSLLLLGLSLANGHDKDPEGKLLNSVVEAVDRLDKKIKELEKAFLTVHKVAMFPGGRIVGNKVFKSNGYEGNFEDLMKKCEDAGGQLATPRNVVENDAVHKIVLLYNKAAFLGITDVETEGTFKYMNNQHLTYANWVLGEPNNEGHENCVELISNGKWNDKSCGEKRLLVCEF